MDAKTNVYANVNDLLAAAKLLIDFVRENAEAVKAIADAELVKQREHDYFEQR